VTVALVTAGPDVNFREHHEARTMVEDSGRDVVTIAVNGAGALHPNPLHHWASVHPEHFPEWENGRKGYVRWSAGRSPHTDRVLKGWQGGSSGYFAVGVALDGLGCEGVVLCGVRIDASPNPTNPESVNGWGDYRRFRHRWTEPRRRDLLARRVRSMSGWTREQFGAPEAEWLRSF
jgi:hypothetical protein